MCHDYWLLICSMFVATISNHSVGSCCRHRPSHIALRYCRFAIQYRSRLAVRTISHTILTYPPIDDGCTPEEMKMTANRKPKPFLYKYLSIISQVIAVFGRSVIGHHSVNSSSPDIFWHRNQYKSVLSHPFSPYLTVHQAYFISDVWRIPVHIYCTNYRQYGSLNMKWEMSASSSHSQQHSHPAIPPNRPQTANTNATQETKGRKEPPTTRDDDDDEFHIQSFHSFQWYWYLLVVAVSSGIGQEEFSSSSRLSS